MSNRRSLIIGWLLILVVLTVFVLQMYLDLLVVSGLPFYSPLRYALFMLAMALLFLILSRTGGES